MITIEGAEIPYPSCCFEQDGVDEAVGSTGCFDLEAYCGVTIDR